MKENDNLKEICIKQGYIPPKCRLPGIMIMGLIQKGENPCDGCNHDRVDCNGSPKKLSKHDEEMYDSYVKEQELRIEKEKRGFKRLNNKSNELVMELSIDRDYKNVYTDINIKDRITENCYTMKLKDGCNKCCDIASMFIKRFKIKEVHIDITNEGLFLHDCLLHSLKINNINWCDVIGFRHRRLTFDTHINNYEDQQNFTEEHEIADFN